jgi:hypothetical protein
MSSKTDGSPDATKVSQRATQWLQNRRDAQRNKISSVVRNLTPGHAQCEQSERASGGDPCRPLLSEDEPMRHWPYDPERW